MVSKLISVNNCLQFLSINFNIIVVYNKVTDCGALESRDLRLLLKHISKSCVPRIWPFLNTPFKVCFSGAERTLLLAFSYLTAAG